MRTGWGVYILCIQDTRLLVGVFNTYRSYTEGFCDGMLLIISFVIRDTGEGRGMGQTVVEAALRLTSKF
jgi:hypothetical protein